MISILQGDVLDKLAELPDNSVHTCITSPPYWGLRSYLQTDDPLKVSEIGLEKTPEEYIAKMVQVFGEVKRVLRDDGTLWLNLGDSYAGSGKGAVDVPNPKTKEVYIPKRSDIPQAGKTPDGLKPKDLCGIPWRVALALQADGWWLRSDIIWAKPNPMPESVTDRPTKSHEYIFLLTKSQRYFYDNEAVKENVAESTLGRGPVDFGGAKGRAYNPDKDDPNYRAGSEQWGRTFDYKISCATGRNLRSVWTITTKGYAEAHFATFPPEIPERCIKAGTSEKGVCSKCGAGWVRVVEKQSHCAVARGAVPSSFRALGQPQQAGVTTTTTGYEPGCTCNADVIPATVLDCFGGSGTTGQVAENLGRNAILIELNPKYIPLIKKRTHHTNLFVGASQ